MSSEDPSCYTATSDSRSAESRKSVGHSAKVIAWMETIRQTTPNCLATFPGNTCIAHLPDASDMATEWLSTIVTLRSATVIEIEVPFKVLLKASEVFSDSRQWDYLFAVVNMMQNSKTGIACLHSDVINDVLGGWRNAADFMRLLNDQSVFQKVIKPEKNVTATGYRLTQNPDPKAPSILSKKTISTFPKSHKEQAVNCSLSGGHRMASGGGGSGVGVELDGEEVKTERLTGRYRVQSIRLLVDLGNVWDAIRASMSKNWGHLDAAADGAGRLDIVSDSEALEIAERFITDEDDEKAKAGQRSAAVDFARFIAMSVDDRRRMVKWRGGRIYVPECHSGQRLVLSFCGSRESDWLLSMCVVATGGCYVPRFDGH